VMSDDVVELAGDPHALFQNGAARVHLPLAPKLGGLCCELGLPRPQ